MDQKEYSRTPMGAYIRQRTNARRRQIPWQITFQQWWAMWEESGSWLQRGQLPEQYRMVRIDPTGPYSPENSVIQQRPAAIVRQQYKLLEDIPTLYSQGVGPWDYLDGKHKVLDRYRAAMLP